MQRNASPQSILLLIRISCCSTQDTPHGHIESRFFEESVRDVSMPPRMISYCSQSLPIPNLMTTTLISPLSSSPLRSCSRTRRLTLMQSQVCNLHRHFYLSSIPILHSKALLTGANGFGNHFNFIYSPLSGELSLSNKHPEAAATIANTPSYAQHLDELRSAIAPELELIESRVVGPVKEFQGVLKVIRKTITKRDHKLIDYDRYNNSLTKLRDKKEKSLSDEKNLFKVCRAVHACCCGVILFLINVLSSSKILR